MCIDTSGLNSADMALGMYGAGSLVQIGAGTAGAVMQYNATKEASRFNRQILARNREIALQQAEIAKEIGAQAVSKHRQQVRGLVGRQRAAYAAAGVLVGSGSPDQIVQQSRELGAADEEILRRNTDQEIWGYRQQAENIAMEMKFEKAKADNALLNASLSTTFNFLDAASRFGTRYYEWAEKNEKTESKVKNWGDPWTKKLPPPPWYMR